MSLSAAEKADLLERMRRGEDVCRLGCVCQELGIEQEEA